MAKSPERDDRLDNATPILPVTHVTQDEFDFQMGEVLDLAMNAPRAFEDGEIVRHELSHIYGRMGAVESVIEAASGQSIDDLFAEDSDILEDKAFSLVGISQTAYEAGLTDTRQNFRIKAGNVYTRGAGITGEGTAMPLATASISNTSGYHEFSTSSFTGGATVYAWVHINFLANTYAVEVNEASWTSEAEYDQPGRLYVPLFQFGIDSDKHIDTDTVQRFHVGDLHFEVPLPGAWELQPPTSNTDIGADPDRVSGNVQLIHAGDSLCTEIVPSTNAFLNESISLIDNKTNIIYVYIDVDLSSPGSPAISYSLLSEDAALKTHTTSGTIKGTSANGKYVIDLYTITKASGIITAITRHQRTDLELSLLSGDVHITSSTLDQEVPHYDLASTCIDWAYMVRSDASDGDGMSPHIATSLTTPHTFNEDGAIANDDTHMNTGASAVLSLERRQFSVEDGRLSIDPVSNTTVQMYVDLSSAGTGDLPCDAISWTDACMGAICHDKLDFNCAAGQVTDANADRAQDGRYWYSTSVQDTDGGATGGIDIKSYSTSGLLDITNTTAAGSGVGAIATDGGVYAASGIYVDVGTATNAGDLNSLSHRFRFCNEVIDAAGYATGLGETYINYDFSVGFGVMTTLSINCDGDYYHNSTQGITAGNIGGGIVTAQHATITDVSVAGGGAAKDNTCRAKVNEILAALTAIGITA